MAEPLQVAHEESQYTHPVPSWNLELGQHLVPALHVRHPSASQEAALQSEAQLIQDPEFK